MRTKFLLATLLVTASAAFLFSDDRATDSKSSGARRGRSLFSSPSASPSSKPRPARQSLDEKFLFQGAKFPAGRWQPNEGARFVDAEFAAADGTKLHGWYYANPAAKHVLLFCHGNGGNVSYYHPKADLLYRLGMSVLVFDYRGYGKSAGVPTVEGVLQDGRAAREWLVKQAQISDSELIIHGWSLGGAVATQLAAEKAPKALVLEGTFSSLKDIAKVHFGNLSLLVPNDRFNSTSAITTYQGPLLDFHGTADQVVPFALGQKLFAAANEPKTFVTLKGLNHNDPLPQEYVDQYQKFLDEIGKK